MTAIQEFMRGHGTTEEKRVALAERYGITTKLHPSHPELIHFKYDQIHSPFGEQIVRECRGIILNGHDDWAIVSRAFDKFFNYGEGNAAQIDWSTATVQEKVDGSLCVVYPYRGEWHVATTGTANGHGDVHGRGRTFAEYFWDTIERYGNPFATMAPDYWEPCSFVFEICGPDNRIVVPHTEPHLWVLGCREASGEWSSAEDAASILNARDSIRSPIPAVRSFPLQSFEDISRSFETMSPLTQEGYVVVDGKFNRVKVKHPGYVALHHAKDGMTEKAFIEIARKGETCEVLAAFPEFKPLMDAASERLDRLIDEVNADYSRLRHIETQKDFALQATKTKLPGALFAVRAGKARDVRQFVAEMRIDNLRELL
jgi:hypothetical protein